jgi:hypothetical protein
MIDMTEKKYGDIVWLVSTKLNEILNPQEEKFHSPESLDSDKLAFIETTLGKKLCCPTTNLFDTQLEAKIYASVKFIREYHDIEYKHENDIKGRTLKTHTTLTEIDRQNFLIAVNMVSEFEEKYPELVLLHLMQAK